jgi:myo-inositol-1(or 4)-monophosphatase
VPHDDLLALARSVAEEAAALIRLRRADGVAVADVKSSPVDVVTEVDREAEALIRRRLAEARPDDGFLGEESGAAEGSSGLTWVVDPIDGTVNFLYGIPHYAVSIAVVEGEPDPQRWRALAGCVVNAGTGEVFEATAGGGAFLDGVPLTVAEPVELSQALVATGFAYDAGVRAEQGALVASLVSRVRDIRRMGTASLDFCAVAAGRMDAYVERTLKPWDHAAGALIAAEAGALVTGAGDAAPDHELVLAAHPRVAADLKRLLAELQD